MTSLDNIMKSFAPRQARAAEPNPCRRRILRGMLVSGMALMAPWQQLAAAVNPRALKFHHAHTGENLSIVYFADGNYVESSFAAINQFLRDFRTDEIHPIDPGLMDILYSAKLTAGHDGTFEVISGYRSPATNESLHKKSDGVARKSLHIEGKAIDVRLSGFDTAALKEIAIALSGGGVGYYAESDFVHLDTGRVRTW